jgi:hypothetical protein
LDSQQEGRFFRSNRGVQDDRPKKIDFFDPTGEFKKIDQVLPKKKGEKGKDRVKDIESALDWCRIKEVKPSGVDEDSPAFNKIAREIEGALDWIRTDRVSPEDADVLPDFSQIESIPVSRRRP